MEKTTNSSEEKLVRALGLKDIITLTINAVIGAGIFVLPAAVAKMMGVSSPIAFIGAGIFTLIIVLCFAELGGKFERTGGAYLYAMEAYGGAFAFIVGWMYFLGRLTAVSALSGAFVGFAGLFMDTATPIREILIAIILSILGFINLVGIRSSKRMINVLTAIKLTVLGIFVVAGILAVHWNVFSAVTLPPVKELGAALLLVLFAFSGFEIIVIPGAEMINARRNLPMGILIGTGVTIVTYLLIQVVCVGTFPGLASSSSPIAEASSLFLGSKAALLITAGAMFSTIGTLTSLILAGPRILYAMSLSNQMPQIFSRVHSKFRTPYVAILFFTGLGLVCSLSSTFQDLATLSVMARLISYIGCAAAVPILRKKLPTPHTFHIPGGVTVPALAIILSLFLLTAANEKHFITGSIALLVGLVLYFVTAKSIGKKTAEAK